MIELNRIFNENFNIRNSIELYVFLYVTKQDVLFTSGITSVLFRLFKNLIYTLHNSTLRIFRSMHSTPSIIR